MRGKTRSRRRPSPRRQSTTARAAARYSDTMRELIQRLKYRDRQEGLPLFARWLARAGAELLADAELIVPVPLYPSWLW
jgi:predicted amidophosphoribosyltransferase